MRIWGSERPSHANQEFDRNAPKLNVSCAMNGFQIIGPYFFPNDTVNANDYCDMLNPWFLPKLRNKATAMLGLRPTGVLQHMHCLTQRFLADGSAELVPRIRICWIGHPDHLT